MTPQAPQMQTFNPSVLGSNPWDQAVNQDSMTAQNNNQMAQGALSSLNTQIAGMGGQPASGAASGSYPAFPNSYNIGSSPASQGAALGSAPSPTSTVVDTTTRGTNPYSLTGEANVKS